MKQKRYNKEFKETIVELYRTGTLIYQLASEYGVTEVSNYL
ncbi:transposase [Viridibacillus sp. FSL E2-0187]